MASKGNAVRKKANIFPGICTGLIFANKFDASTMEAPEDYAFTFQEVSPRCEASLGITSLCLSLNIISSEVPAEPL